MRVVVTGSSGFLGSALIRGLVEHGHEVLRLVRPGAPAMPGTAMWDPERGVIDTACLKWSNAVVHLAGAAVGAHRWGKAYKETILLSRTVSTRLLADSLAGLARPSAVLLTASATGFYGNRAARAVCSRC
jgi:NAD dependent epimerase/dehydratase family enzyme